MTRWQYRVVNLGAFGTKSRLQDALGCFGQNGWELVGVYDKASNWFAQMEKGFVMFKRPVPDGSEPDGPWAEVWSADAVSAASLPTPGEDGYITPT